MSTMPPLPDPAEKHSAESRRAMSQRFIMEARIELETGNRMQAGEKAWNALAQYYKLIADGRGWNHDATRELESMGRHLVARIPRACYTCFHQWSLRRVSPGPREFL